jgi:hypothetical protein
MGLPFLLTTVTVAHFSFSSFAMLLETEYVLTLRYFLTTCFAGRRMGALFALFIQPFFHLLMAGAACFYGSGAAVVVVNNGLF